VFDGIYNVEASAQWLFATARNNLLQDNTAANNTNLIYNLIQILQPASKRWKWIVLTERFEFRSNQNKQIYYFLDTEFAWDLKKPKMLLTLEVKNLFNVQQIEQLSFSNFAITANTQRLQSRWGLLKVQFKF
jgi:outer membrane receptor protein involved in Fe transport